LFEERRVNLLDSFPFPFADLRAQELMRVLAALYPSQREALPLVVPLGVDRGSVTFGLKANNMWFELLPLLAAQRTLRKAVETVVKQFPKNPRSEFLRELLADEAALLSAEPPENQPPFDDTVTEPEALLFFDDLTMPTGKLPGLIETLQKLFAASPAVCLLRVQNQYGSFYGTGFRISDQLILTNHHVLFPRKTQATGIVADFGFDVTPAGMSTPVTSLQGKLETVKGERADDWAVVAVDGMNPQWPTLSLADLSTPKVGDPAFILQHPGGQQKRLGFVRNTISDVKDGVIRYLTDTQPGSSGAPVFDSAARLIALHHAGGQPVEVAGKPPVAKNEGVRITRVAERLRATNLLR
jgi:S1-C subfamily serine protease